MELLTKEDISIIVQQILGHQKPLRWSLNKHSAEELGFLGEHLSLVVEVDSGFPLKFFVKCLPRYEEWKAQYIKENTFFEKEYGMLKYVFQKFGQGTKKWRPTVYFVKKEVFVFEDVVPLGYRMIRQDTLTLEQVKACIETMARFHAQSYIYEEKRSKELGRSYRIWEDYSEYLREPNRNQNWREAGKNAVIDFIKEFSKYKTTANFHDNVERGIQKLFDDSLLIMKPHSLYRNVIVHRDLWMNNIFFKKEPNDTLHALFVDYQTVLYCPPMLDFSSFLYFNTKRDLRDRYRAELINIYYSILCEELKVSNIDIADIIDEKTLKNCYEQTLSFGLCQAALIVPIALLNKQTNQRIFNDPEKLNKFYEISRSEVFIDNASSDERYRVHLIELFDEIVEKCILINI